MSHAPTYEDVLAASGRIRSHAQRAPVMTSRTAHLELHAQLFFKCENFQCVGALKLRGSFNALECLEGEKRRARVVAYSSGNHAQAIALAARILDMPVLIVMPQDAPFCNVAASAGYGAQTQHLGWLNFELIKRDVDDILTVGDGDLIEGVRFLAERMKLKFEPTGCLGFAAARRFRECFKRLRVGGILSVGNVDLKRFTALTSSASLGSVRS